MNSKKVLTLLLRFAVSAAMLGYLAIKIDQSSHTKSGNHGVLPPWNSTTATWLGLAAVLTMVSQILASMRWRAVLNVLEVKRIPPLRTLVSLHLAGQFVGNVLPSTVGGDVLRVTRLRAEGVPAPDSFASVVLERLTGWLVLPVLILIGFTINRGLLRVDHAATTAVLIALATLALLGVTTLLLASRRVGGRLGRNEGWRSFAGAVHLGVARFRDHPISIVQLLAWAFAYQLVLVMAAFCAARTLGVDAVGFTALLTFFPAVLIVQVLPISISGLGLREGLFVVFLTPLGVPEGKSVALGILIYLLTLVISFFGAPSFAFGKRKVDPSSITSSDDPTNVSFPT